MALLRFYILFLSFENFSKLRNSKSRNSKKNIQKRNNSLSSDHNSTINSSLDSSHQGASNGGKYMSLPLIGSEIILHFTFYMFVAIACHLLMLETCIYYHSTRHDKTNLTSYFSSFYNHWMASYCNFTFFFEFRSFKKF